MTLFAGIEPDEYLWVVPGDNGPGTQDQPMGSIKAAMAQASPGTAVMVKAGTYVERVDITHGGEADLPIWLISADGKGAAKVESDSSVGGTIWGFGVANLVVWAKVFETHRRIVLGAGMVGVHGRIQREGEVVHFVVHQITDLSAALASVGQRNGAAFPLVQGRGDEARHEP